MPTEDTKLRMARENRLKDPKRRIYKEAIFERDDRAQVTSCFGSQTELLHGVATTSWTAGIAALIAAIAFIREVTIK